MKHPNQITGNIGLFWVCYKLSQLGWNAMPTSRNARGIDVVAFSTDGSRMVTLQVKTLADPFSGASNISVGRELDRVGMANWWVIVIDALREPRAFILSPEEVKRLSVVKTGKQGSNYWLRARAYEHFHDRWERIGSPA